MLSFTLKYWYYEYLEIKTNVYSIISGHFKIKAQKTKADAIEYEAKFIILAKQKGFIKV